MKITNFIACLLLPITILNNCCYSANDSCFSAGRTLRPKPYITTRDDFFSADFPNEITCYADPSKQCNSELKVRKELLNPNSEIIDLNVKEMVWSNGFVWDKFRLNDNLNKELSKNIPHYDELQVGVVKYENKYYLAFYEADYREDYGNTWYYTWYYIDGENDLGLLGYTPLF